MSDKMRGTAILLSTSHGGHRHLYRVWPPMPNPSEGSEYFAYEYVTVSAAHVPKVGPQTFIFGSDKDGHIISWHELDGSFQGAIDHEQALRNAGYTVTGEHHDD